MKYAYCGIPHEVFVQPDDPDIPLWRYTDFAQFIAMISSRSLHLSRLDKLGDPFEGSLPKRSAGFIADQMRGIREALRVGTAVSCWHMNEHESAAMWQLYVSGRQGVCVRSTFSRLRDSLPQGSPDSAGIDSIRIGKIRYIDYEREALPTMNALSPYMHKRLSFEHERELRAVVQNINERTVDGVRRWDETAPGFPDSGLDVPVDLERLIERVYVSPLSPPWYVDVVRSAVRQYGHGFDVHQSAMDVEPLL